MSVSADHETVHFPGVYAATTTPFRDDGSVDSGEFAKHCGWLVDEGVAGLIPNGSLGEYEGLSDSERAELVVIAIDAAAGRVPVIPGVSGKSAREACRWAEQAGQAGAGAVMALPPTAHKPTDNEVVAHFAEIARVGLPIIAYNNPFSTRVDLVPALLARLAGIEQVQAVKEFSQDARRVAQIREQAPRLEVICGCDDVFVESMLLGATGWIAGLVNAFPAALVRLYELCAGGEYVTAAGQYRAMLPALRWDADPRFVQAIKLAQEEAGRYGGPVRLPRLPLPPSEAAAARADARAALAA
ncbi:MAG TPA: dihydrodipicolinate synthase family protein [Streptosporangiaceae bacterium]|jgi:4-hydroxy-tetrahydrodipicolinate synthase